MAPWHRVTGSRFTDGTSRSDEKQEGESGNGSINSYITAPSSGGRGRPTVHRRAQKYSRQS